MVQPLWKTVWRFLKKLKVELPYDPAIPLLSTYPKKTKDSKRNWSPCTLLVVMENSAGAVENSMEVPQKITDRTTI